MKKVFCLCLIAVAFFLSGSLTSASAQSQGPIRVGFLAPLSGGLAQNGKDMLDGFQLYLEEISNQMEGRKIEFIPEDTEGNRHGLYPKPVNWWRTTRSTSSWAHFWHPAVMHWFLM